METGTLTSQNEMITNGPNTFADANQLQCNSQTPLLTFAPVMSVVNGLFFDDLGRATLSQVEQNLQEVVEARFAARFLYPDVEQCVDAIFVGEPLLSLDRVVADAKVAKELLVIVHVEFLKILKAVAQ